MSSKLSNLKQEAYQAAKRRNWAEAISIYERLLDLDKNNPALQNELGDICLKNQDTPKAVRQFLGAGSKYKQNGLLNNAVAVYKKVLRHEPENISAHWFLAEVRASQGLIVEGEVHALKFLAAAAEVAGEIKEIFLKRCVQLLTLYPTSRPILEQMQGVFRVWNLPLEEARTTCLLAAAMHIAGEEKEASALAKRALEFCPEVANYGEYTRWQAAIGAIAKPSSFADVNTLTLSDTSAAVPPPAPAATIEPEPAPDAARPHASPEAPAVDVFEVFLDSSDEQRDEDGCICIDTPPADEQSFDDLIHAASASIDEPEAPADEDAPGSVDLLQEILADVGDDLGGGDEEQVDTITSEIGQQVGGDDPETTYQQGLVYLEMGLHEQAAESFAAAARSSSHVLRACEMWGIALMRDGRAADALKAFAQGLASAGHDPAAAFGLRYHAGQACEELGRIDEARAHYEQIHALDPEFLDVSGRLRELVG